MTWYPANDSSSPVAGSASHTPAESAPAVRVICWRRVRRSGPSSIVEDRARLTLSSRSISSSFSAVCRASSAFSAARATWDATASMRRTSEGLQVRPRAHHTRKMPPTTSPRTRVGANRTAPGPIAVMNGKS